MRTIALIVVTWGAVAVTAAAPARAADPIEEAKRHFQRAQTHFAAGEFRPAAEAYKETYRLHADPTLLFNIALCHGRLGDRAEALANYRLYLQRAPTAPNRAEVEGTIAELERQLAQPPGPMTAPAFGATTPGAPPPAHATPATGGHPPAYAAPASVPGTPPGAGAGAGAPVYAPPYGAPPAQQYGAPPIPPGYAPPPSQPDLGLAGGPEAPAVEAPKTESRPFYTRWWFWGVVGAVAIGTAVVVVAVAGDPGTRDPYCGTFRPGGSCTVGIK